MTSLILHIITHPDGGGAEKVVHLLSSNSCMTSKYQVFNIYLNNPRSHRLKSHEISLNLPSLFSFTSILTLRRTIRALTEGFSSVLIHAHLCQPLYLVPFATFGLNVKRVFTEHNSWNRRRKYSILRLLEFFIYLFYSKIFCISFSVRDSLIDWLSPIFPSNRFSVIYNGTEVNSTSSSLTITSEHPERTLLSIGSLTKQKGFDCSLKALSLIREHFTSYTILGSGPEYYYLQDLIRSLDLDNKVQLLGFKSEINSYITSSSLGLIPSRWEGFGLVLVEFLSLGLPVVTSSAKGMDEISKGCPAVIRSPSLDPDILSSSILNGMDHLAHKPDIQRLAIDHSKRFSINSMVNSYIHHYTQILS